MSFDPRGTNRSSPVRCDADLVTEMPNTAPDAGATLADIQAWTKNVAHSCREHTARCWTTWTTSASRGTSTRCASRSVIAS